MGMTAQVPHYLVQFEFPRAATVLLDGRDQRTTGLVLPIASLEAAASRADAEIAQQLEGNEEFATVVSALEQQYDQVALPSPRGRSADMTDEQMPSADEFAAQVEQFLSSLSDPGTARSRRRARTSLEQDG